MDIVQIAMLKAEFNEEFLTQGEAADPNQEWYFN